MADKITFYAKKNYDQFIGNDGRAMTIASFHIAQDSTVLSQKPMRRDILNFLMSPSAVNYWTNTKKWLETCGKNENGKNLLRLTAKGLSECSACLKGQAATNTTVPEVEKWCERMRNRDHITNDSKQFELPL